MGYSGPVRRLQGHRMRRGGYIWCTRALLLVLCSLTAPFVQAGGTREYSPSPPAAALISEFKLFQSDLYRQFNIETDRDEYVHRTQQWHLRSAIIRDDQHAYNYLEALIDLESAIWIIDSFPGSPRYEELRLLLFRADRTSQLVIDANIDFAAGYALRADIYTYRFRVAPILQIIIGPVPGILNRIALRLDSRNPRTYLHLGNEYLRSLTDEIPSASLQLAIRSYRDAVRYAGPEDVGISVRAGLWLSYALTLIGENDEALAAAEEVLQLSPRNPIALLVKAAIAQGTDPIDYINQ